MHDDAVLRVKDSAWPRALVGAGVAAALVAGVTASVQPAFAAGAALLASLVGALVGGGTTPTRCARCGARARDTDARCGTCNARFAVLHLAPRPARDWGTDEGDDTPDD